jgi:hypothetical protein
MYKELVQYHNFNPETTRRVEDKGFPVTDEGFLELINSLSVNDWYVCEAGGLPTGCAYWITVFRTEKGILFYHDDIIYFVSNSLTLGTFQTDAPDENMWKEVFKLIGYNNLVLNQYKYCDAVLNAFWKLVFGKTASEMWCGGIVGAHGDKAYGYKKQWEKAGIPFNHGVLLFLLTYTSEIDREKCGSDQFVIDKYHHYLPMIQQAEKETFFI